jgi:hypothetical protein
LNAADAAGARQLTSTDRATSSPDASDEDDDGDDSDGFSALPAVASPAPVQVDRSVSWLLIHPAFEPTSSPASDSHSLRAPPQ